MPNLPINNSTHLQSLLDLDRRNLYWSIDTNLRLTSFNQRFIDVTEQLTGNLISRGSHVLHAADSPELAQFYKSMYETALNGTAVDKIVKTEEPVQFWSEIHMQPIWEDNAISGVACLAVDITDRVLSERAVKASDERFKAIIENSVEAIVLLNQNEDITYCSRSFFNITGYLPHELSINTWTQIMHPEDIEAATVAIRHSLKSPGVPIPNAVRIKHKTQGWIYTDGFVTNMLENESVQSLVLNIHNITEKKRALDNLVHANSLLSFINHVSKSIVHSHDEATLFKEVCSSAVKTAGFKMAWIGFFSPDNTVMRLASHCGIAPDDLSNFTTINLEEIGPFNSVRLSAQPFICNSIEDGDYSAFWKSYCNQRGYRSCILLPIHLAGKVVATFNLFQENTIYESKESIATLLKTANDISAALDNFEEEALRTLATAKLKYSEMRLKQAQAIAHLGHWEMDINSVVGFWSEECLKIYGIPADQPFLTFDTWKSYVHPDDLERILSKIKDAQENKTSTSFFHRIIRRDGAIRHIYSQSEPEFNEFGEITKLYGIAHDVTELKTAEIALQQSEENLKKIINLFPYVLYVRDANGKFIFTNINFDNLITQFESVNAKQALEPLFSSDFNVIESEKEQIIPELTIQNNVTSLILQVQKVPYVLPFSETPAILVIAKDITEQQQAEAERAAILADMVQRNKDSEQFSYIVSHNLRAPVANIIGLSDLLQMENQNNANPLVSELANSTIKLDRVIRDLNQILQVRHHVKEISETIIFTELVDNILSSLQQLGEIPDLHINTDFSEVDRIYSIRSYIHSIFYNLISNSIKYCRPGVKPSISIKSTKIPSGTKIVYQDNGLGIDLNKYGDRVFGLYKRFHNHIDGKGMGLFMVKTQVETLGGNISIDSLPNHGTTFTLNFANR